MANRSYSDCLHISSHFSNASAITRILLISLTFPLIVAIRCWGVISSTSPKMRRMRSLRHTYVIGTYNAGQSVSSIVSNPSVGESSCDRNSSYHDLKAHISYVCIYYGCSRPQCGRGKEKGLTPKPKLRHVSPMTGEITGDRCQTCQKDEINHHSFEF